MAGFYNKDYKPLVDLFLSTIQDEKFEIELDFINEKRFEDTPGGGYRLWTARAEWTIEKIKQNLGRCVLFTDLDIQFFKPIYPDICKRITKYDMVFQRTKRWNYPANIGFVITRCNEKTLALWEAVYREIRKGIISDQTFWDEMVVNKKLKTHPKDLLPNTFNIKYQFLPYDYAITYYAKELWEQGKIRKLKIHHETSKREIGKKIERMKMVRKWWEEGK